MGRERKRKHVLCVLFLLTLCLAGCGGKSREELAEDMNRAGTDVGSSSDAEQAGADTGSKASDIPDHITYELTDDNGKQGTLDVDVTASGYDSAGVYDMELVEIDEAYLKELAGQIFDNGEYEVIKPYQACTMDELLAEESFIQSLYTAAGIEGDDVPLSLVSHYISVYNETDMEEWKDGQVIRAAELHYEDGMGGSYDEGYEEAKLRGKINGEVYQLEYEKIDGSSCHFDLVRLCRKPKNTSFYRLYDVDDSLAVTLYGENVCDRNQAEQEACHLMNQMGFPDMEPVYASHLIWNRNEKQYADGYSIIFARTVDGIQNVFCENSLAMFWDGYDRYRSEYNGDVDNAPGSHQEYIMVNVDSTGFVSCTFSVFYRMGERLTEETNKLNFEQVCDVAERYAGDGLWGIIGTKEIRMGYMTLQYEDKYVLAPVWVYMSDAGGNRTYAKFGVNALDGTIVYFGYDYGIGDMFWPDSIR